MRSERLMYMENYIYEKQTVTLDELCEIFHVSKNTVRRDIEQIVESTNIKKTYGGVTIDTAIKKEILSFEERTIRNAKIKQKIAEKASRFIEDGDIIFLDSGTTISPIIPSIKHKNVTILTNNLPAIIAAAPYENLNIITLSGTLRRKTLSFTGISATDILKTYNITKAFMASTGISISGATNFSPDETCIKRMAIERSTLRYLLVDHTKYNVNSLLTFCHLPELNAIISDELPPDDILEVLTANNVKMIID
ncbi:DeoR/GlpR family DNA-binding transcription regulator [Lachnospiraceae bacterium ZAX-1]